MADADTASADGSANTASASLRLVYGEDAGIGGQVQTLDAMLRTVQITDIDRLNASIPCYTPGSFIATERGEVAVANLKLGDRLVTRDNGLQKIEWIGQTPYAWQDLGLNPLLRPVLIRAGSLGSSVPERDLLVSPNHRMLLGQGDDEVLVAARDLTRLPGINVVSPNSVTYVQLLLSHHQAILADGAWSESFEPTMDALEIMSDANRHAIKAVTSLDSRDVLRPVATSVDLNVRAL